MTENQQRFEIDKQSFRIYSKQKQKRANMTKKKTHMCVVFIIFLFFLITVFLFFNYSKWLLKSCEFDFGVNVYNLRAL